MVIFRKTALTKWQIGILAIAIFLPLYLMGPEIWPDTDGYLHFAPYRPPIYPIFLWLFHGFGKQQLVIAIWAQALLFFLAILHTAYWLADRLEFSRSLIFLIFLSLILLLDHFLACNNIASDIISLSLFLPVVTLFVDCCHIVNIKKLILLVITSNLLILTREQFYYLYPLLGALILWYIWKKESARKIASSFGIIILSIVVTFYGNRWYHCLANHGSSSAVPAVAVLEQALYLSDHADQMYFHDVTQKNYFTKTIRLLEKKQLTKNTMDVPNINRFHPMTLDVTDQMYNLAYLPIIHAARVNFPISDFYSQKASAFTEKVVLQLYRHNLRENIVFSAWRIMSFMGGIWVFTGFMIALFFMISRIMTDRKWQPTIKQLFVIVAFFLILNNAIVVGLFADNEPRYFYYCYFLYFCLFGLLANELFIKRSDGHSSQKAAVISSS